MYCNGINDLFDIDFENFTSNELDSVLLIQYQDNTFQQAIDTAYYVNNYLYEHSNGVMLQLDNPISINYNYEIYLPQNQQSYLLSNFKSKKKKCNSGFMCFDKYSALESYQVNGQLYEFGYIKILP